MRVLRIFFGAFTSVGEEVKEVEEVEEVEEAEELRRPLVLALGKEESTQIG